MASLIDCSMLAASLSFARHTSTLVSALHVGSERLLAGFDALSGVSHGRAPEDSADFFFTQRTKSLTQQQVWEAVEWGTALEKDDDSDRYAIHASKRVLAPPDEPERWRIHKSPRDDFCRNRSKGVVAKLWLTVLLQRPGAYNAGDNSSHSNHVFFLQFHVLLAENNTLWFADRLC